MGLVAESCPIKLTILICSPIVTCLYSLITLNPLHSLITLVESPLKEHTLFSSPKPTTRPSGGLSFDIFLTFEAPPPAFELDRLYRARTSSKTFFSSRALRPTRFCQEVPKILLPSASLLCLLNVLFIFFSILNAL